MLDCEVDVYFDRYITNLRIICSVFNFKFIFIHHLLIQYILLGHS